MTFPPAWLEPFETPSFLLRPVAEADAENLLACYSDPDVWPLFNADNCLGGFEFTTIDQMRNAVRFWAADGPPSGYVRYAVIDKAAGRAVGTVEMFGQPADDASDLPWGLLRLDIAAAYENADHLGELLELAAPLGARFGARRILTRVPAEAGIRRDAAAAAGFTPYPWTRPGATQGYLAVVV